MDETPQWPGEIEVSEPISNIVSEEEVASGEGANKIKQCILDSSVLFWGIHHPDCAAVLQLAAEQREFNKLWGELLGD